MFSYFFSKAKKVSKKGPFGIGCAMEHFLHFQKRKMAVISPRSYDPPSFLAASGALQEHSIAEAALWLRELWVLILIWLKGIKERVFLRR